MTVKGAEMWSQVVKKSQVPKVWNGRNYGRGGKARSSVREEKTNNAKIHVPFGEKKTTNAKKYVTVSILSRLS